MTLDSIVGCIANNYKGLFLVTICLNFARGVTWGSLSALAALVFIWVLVIVNERFVSAPWGKYGENSVALVTGGAHGLGKEIVNEFLKRGISRVIILDRDAPTDHDDQSWFYQCNLEDESQVQKCMAQILSDLEHENLYISILVNNAGVRIDGPLLETDIAEFRRTFQVNAFSPIYIAQCVLKQQCREPGSQLYVVTVSLVLATLAPAHLLAYSASKSAIWLAHEALLTELVAEKDVRLLLVAPGQLDTRMFNDLKVCNLFFAPVISHSELARKISDCVFSGRQGVLCLPFYANFLPVVRCFPYSWQRLVRWLSGMDTCME